MHRRAWTKQEVEMLKKLYPTNSTRDLVDIFKRSYNSILGKAKSLGLKKDPAFLRETLLKAQKRACETRKDSWTKSDLEKLKEMYESGLSIREIARILGRGEAATRVRASKLGLRRALDEANKNGRLGEKIAEDIIKHKGWKIIEKGTPNSPFDFIVEINRKRFILNVKYSPQGFTVTKTNLERMFKLGQPAIMYLTDDGRCFFMEVSRI